VDGLAKGGGIDGQSGRPEDAVGRVRALPAVDVVLGEEAVEAARQFHRVLQHAAPADAPLDEAGPGAAKDPGDDRDRRRRISPANFGWGVLHGDAKY